jgi:hypothetical protein
MLCHVIDASQRLRPSTARGGCGPGRSGRLIRATFSGVTLAPLAFRRPTFFRLIRTALGFVAFRGSTFFFGAFLIIRAPVIGGIKTRALEYQSCTCSNQPFDLPFTPNLLPAQLLRANRIRRVVHRLEGIKCLITLFAFIFVGGHR